MNLNYTVSKIPGKVGREFIREHHYSRTCHNGPMTWGLWEGPTLIGVLAFATPASENVRNSVFKEDNKDHVTELHRLVVLDRTPKNTESWFISRGLKALKEYRPQIWGVLSFADQTEGHIGTIYQATNALYLGTTPGRSRFWRDKEGRLRHPRQSGHNVTIKEATQWGWTAEYRDPKHRYLYLLPDTRSHLKELRQLLKQEILPYPKKGDEDTDEDTTD